MKIVESITMKRVVQKDQEEGGRAEQQVWKEAARGIPVSDEESIVL